MERVVRDPLQLELDALLGRLEDLARLLPALTARNGLDERNRLVAALECGGSMEPRFDAHPRPIPRDVWAALKRARVLAPSSPAPGLYRDRLDELELDLSMIEALGDPRRVRPLAARRFGTGATVVATASGPSTLHDVARAILSTADVVYEPRVLPPQALAGEPSFAELIRRVAQRAGIEVRVVVEPRLAAAAATGERTVFIADRCYGVREAIRLVVHEVLGHLVAAANGRTQPLRVIGLGTAGSFADQEGVALWLEEEVGAMDGLRLRTLAARVWTTDRMHADAPFGETVRLLHREHGFDARDSVALAERAWRGGGVARDAGYLLGWLRVRRALSNGTATLDELRSGRVGLADVGALRALGRRGLWQFPAYRPSLAYSLGATEAGTSLLTSPPSFAASLTRLELT